MKIIETDVLIVGAGPAGLFCVFELGQLGIKCCMVDSLNEIGGQCTALYPEKPIFDIPAYKSISGKDLVVKLKSQISPFKPNIQLDQTVEKIAEQDNSFLVETSKRKQISCKCIIIAAGTGVFGPNKPPIKDIEKYEDKSVFYSIKNKALFNNKNIVIAGGGDSAVDWAIELSKNAKKVYFLHRRTKLRAAPNSLEKLYDLENKGKVKMIIPYQADSIIGESGQMKELKVKNLDNKFLNIKSDFFLPFFGLSANLGPIKEWELDIEKSCLKVNQSTCETNKKGIFAIGDICKYDGKLKLILTGFSEAAIAAHSCYEKVFPGKALHFEYSTTKGINSV